MNMMRTEIGKSILGRTVLTEDGGQQRFRFADDFIGFTGHFPDYPILPAVLQTLMAQMLAEQVVGLPLQFLALERAKFTHQLRPGDQIEVSVSCREKQGQLHSACEFRVAGKRAASFTLLLGKGSEE